MALRKLQHFFTKVMGSYHFFDGSGPNFFCSVNEPFVKNLLVSSDLGEILLNLGRRNYSADETVQ